MPITEANTDSALAVAWLLFADFVDLPVRGAFAGQPVFVPDAIAGGDADCWNITFNQLNPDILSIAPVQHSDGGSQTFQFVLSVSPDASADLLSAIENPALYLGRRVRIWHCIIDAAGTVQHIKSRYRGYMTVPVQAADANSFTIGMEAENYLSLLSVAQGRTYVESTLYDAGDLSGAVVKSGGMRAGALNGPAVDTWVNNDLEPRQPW